MIVIGHRGARGLAPENTAASIKAGLAAGVDEIEIDIRITEDGIPVLNHDRFIIESSDWRAIATHTLAEIKKFKPDITTLAEALDLVAGTSALYIEVKHGEPTLPVVKVIEEHRKVHGSKPGLLLGSKSQRVLRELHQSLPDIPKVVIEPWSGVRASYRARQVQTKRISMRSWWLWGGFLRAMQRRGYQITPYTLNDPAKVKKWQPYIYGVITDFPDRMQELRGRD
jgi:glycerophosphoryl diester phosphodiesterase